MKKFVVENAGIFHIVLFIMWMGPMLVCFLAGTTIFNQSIWIPLGALISLIVHLVLAVVESDWQEQIMKSSGYDK